MITDTINTGLTGDDGTRLSGSSIEVGNARVSLDTSIPAGSIDTPITLAFFVANVMDFIIMASVDMTLKTNSASAPGNTLLVKAGNPWRWEKSSGYYPNPFTADVTGGFVTSVQAGTIKIRVLTS